MIAFITSIFQILAATPGAPPLSALTMNFSCGGFVRMRGKSRSTGEHRGSSVRSPSSWMRGAQASQFSTACGTWYNYNTDAVKETNHSWHYILYYSYSCHSKFGNCLFIPFEKIENFFRYYESCTLHGPSAATAVRSDFWCPSINRWAQTNLNVGLLCIPWASF